MTLEVREAARGARPEDWLAQFEAQRPEAERALLEKAHALATELYGSADTVAGAPALAHCHSIAEILQSLRLDAETLAAALLAAAPALHTNAERAIAERVSPAVARLVDGVGRMDQIRTLRSRVDATGTPAQRSAQLESLRKMLLAMVQDMRVVLIALADETQRLRFVAGQGDAATRSALARETFDVFAPLANRLGVWQLKWELEDLAFRCGDPDTYRAIARQLDEKRHDREAFIAEVMARLSHELQAAGIKGEVTGRPKHIYSIYRKLAKKDLTLKELFDIRGVRVLVDDVKDCYAVLGLVHNVWTPLPREFDDYIAKPKPNNYRSLHTAVVGPDGKVLEVQIRTYEMHQQCEYGIAAHWRYKEQGSRAGGQRREAAQFDERVAWLRQILEWRDQLGGATDLAEHFRTGLFEDTVYVLTPQGRVIDLPRGATPVDFAYHVHSDLGHRCRGAKVDGRMVPLNYALDNGETIEIVTATGGGPSRDWLNPELGFIHSARARNKVRQWFNNQNLETAIAQGRQVVEKILQREGATALALDRLATKLGHAKVDDMMAEVGRGELTNRSIANAVHELVAPETVAAPQEVVLPTIAKPTAGAPGSILVVGVDRLLTGVARCCKPAPPDPIIGFVTKGKGVSIHRRTCANVQRLPAERLIEAQWGADAAKGSFAVDVEIEGDADPGLTRELLDVFGREKVRVLAMNARSGDLNARLLFTLEVNSLEHLDRLLLQVRQLPSIAAARRRG